MNPNKVEKPATLAEASARLLGMKDALQVMKEYHEGVMSIDVRYNYTLLGRWIRNNWGLWAGADACPVAEAPLYYYFYERGLRHPGDMSMIIMNVSWAAYAFEPYSLEAELNNVKEYWAGLEKAKWNRINQAVEKVLEKC
ncbi:MAG: hypothetical protein K0U41_02365 [Gammaproteobacteria bacterium]|nr:hypothetical protein [Gammaproteobacteria bacterium]